MSFKITINFVLFQQVLDPSVVGPYDAVVVHADNGALDFFERCGFSDDVVLNSRWRYVPLYLSKWF